MKRADFLSIINTLNGIRYDLHDLRETIIKTKNTERSHVRAHEEIEYALMYWRGEAEAHEQAFKIAKRRYEDAEQIAMVKGETLGRIKQFIGVARINGYGAPYICDEVAKIVNARQNLGG